MDGRAAWTQLSAAAAAACVSVACCGAAMTCKAQVTTQPRR
jgi:hypothetical protein